MKIPSTIRGGDTVQWEDAAAVDTLRRPINSSTHTLTYYLRTSTGGEGATVGGATLGAGWRFTIPAATSAGFDAGNWYFQAVATAISDGAKTTIGAGSITVLPSLSYAGTPGAFDGRSQAEKDLEAVTGAIRALMSGGAVRQYRIGEREVSRYSLSELLELQSRLKAEVAREKKAEMIANGMGNPHAVFVRFGPRRIGYPVRSGGQW